MRLHAVALLCFGLTSGCGGVLHLSKGLGAKRAIEAARTANAGEKAPYHLAIAELYAAQGDIEATSAHGQEALDYDELATAHALQAEAISRGVKPAESPASAVSPPVSTKPSPAKAGPSNPGPSKPGKAVRPTNDEEL